MRTTKILHERSLTSLSFIQYASLLPPFLPAKAICVLSLIGSMTQKMKMAREESCNLYVET